MVAQAVWGWRATCCRTASAPRWPSARRCWYWRCRRPRPGRGDRARRAWSGSALFGAPPRPVMASLPHPVAARPGRRDRCLLRGAAGAAAGRRRSPQPVAAIVRGVLSRRRAGVRRRPRRAAPAASRRWCRRAGYDDAFLAGYGAAQAVPGPLFTFSAYLGTAMGPAPNGWVGAICARRDVPARLPPDDRAAAVLGRAARDAPGRRRRCAVSMPRSSAFCWRRSTIRSGHPASPMPAISRSASPPSCCSSCGRHRRGWSLCFVQSAARGWRWCHLDSESTWRS